MQIVQPSVLIRQDVDARIILKSLEMYGRTCYQRFDKRTPYTWKKFIKMIMTADEDNVRHESVVEHEKVTVAFITDRGVTHELVRHRLASYSQESTRYCNYADERFGTEIKVIDVPFWSVPLDHEDGCSCAICMRCHNCRNEWLDAMRDAERHYLNLLAFEAKPEEARSVLPNSLKTEIVSTFNLREWHHVFRLRTGKRAHPQMRQVMIPLLAWFQRQLPGLYDDIKPGPLVGSPAEIIYEPFSLQFMDEAMTEGQPEAA
jgi:thymidylate synthase (FAD)